MTIQGSTTAFPVRGLLAFLADTGRSGRLLVEAPTRSGVVLLRDGRMTALGLGGEGAPPVAEPADDGTRVGDLVVDLVSLPGGRFTFQPDDADRRPGGTGDSDGIDVREALARAGLDAPDADARPDGRVHVRLAEELPTATATVAPELWEVLARIDGVSLDDLAGRLGLGLATVHRRVDALAALGLAELGRPGTDDGPHSRTEVACR